MLIVDDDMRNIFALTTVLERYDMVIVSADNGREAIESCRRSPDVDIVLMDIMMPEMDGYRDDAGDPQDRRSPRRCRSSP